ncbi:MAG: hypothetical protein AB1394_15810 [Bacteroidota bacterium]
MKKKIFFITIIAILLSTVYVFAQDAPAVADSVNSINLRPELIKKYESKIAQLSSEITKRLNLLIMQNQAVLDAVVSVTKIDPVYQTLISKRELLKEELNFLKSTKQKPINNQTTKEVNK